MSQASSQNEPTMDEILASIRKIISEDQPEDEAAQAEESVAEEASAATEPQPISEVASEVPEAEASAEEPAESEPEIAEPAPEPEIVAVAEVEETVVEEPADAEVEIQPEPEPVEEAVVEPPEPVEALFHSGESSADGGEDGGGIAFPMQTDDLSEDYSAETPEEDELISASARDALDQALAQLDADSEPVGTAVAEGDSIEAVFTRAVQQSFEPTLQEWIEDNQEEIVNRLAPLIREWMDENLPSLIEAAVAKEISRAVRSRRR